MKSVLDNSRIKVLFMLMVLSLSIVVQAHAKQGGTEVKQDVASSGVQIDINKADAAQLATLPGIGPEIAQRIIAYRSEHGSFKTTKELGNVKGIGEKKLSRINPLITVKGSTP